MGINKGFDEREAAEEAKYAHDQDVVHLKDIREVGVDGAAAREKARREASAVKKNEGPTP